MQLSVRLVIVVQLLVPGVMLTEYYFSVFPTPDAQAVQLSNYIRRPYNQATTASGVIQNLGVMEGFHSNPQRGGRFNAFTFRYEKGVLSYHSTSCT